MLNISTNEIEASPARDFGLCGPHGPRGPPSTRHAYVDLSILLINGELQFCLIVI